MQRDYVEYESTEGPYRSVLAHKVTAGTAGEVQTVGGVQVANEGDYLVQSQNAAFVDVYRGEDAFNELGLTATRDQRDYLGENDENADTAEVDSTNEDDFFEPSEHTAAEVHAYLSRDDVSDENKERVRDAEEEGANRKSAFPK